MTCSIHLINKDSVQKGAGEAEKKFSTISIIQDNAFYLEYELTCGKLWLIPSFDGLRMTQGLRTLFIERRE
tara:strand:- start:113 stop:325 length:213 start_codon:yes stop_codon:yes gene_type:complete